MKPMCTTFISQSWSHNGHVTPICIQWLNARTSLLVCETEMRSVYLVRLGNQFPKSCKLRIDSVSATLLGLAMALRSTCSSIFFGKPFARWRPWRWKPSTELEWSRVRDIRPWNLERRRLIAHCCCSLVLIYPVWPFSIITILHGQQLEPSLSHPLCLLFHTIKFKIHCSLH